MFDWNNFNKNQTAIVEEDYSIEVGGDLIAMQEAFQDLADMNVSYAAMNAQAVDAFVQEGSVEGFLTGPVMEGFLGDAKDRIIKALKSLKEKLVAFFKSAVKYFDAMFMSAKKFASKYGDELKAKKLAGFKREMFEYKLGAVPTGDAVFKDVQKVVDEFTQPSLSNVAKGLTEDKRSFETRAMKALGGDTGSREAFRKSIYKKLRNGATVKKEIAPNIGEIVNALADGELVKDVEEAMKGCEQAFDDQIKKIEDIKSDVDSTKPGHENMTKLYKNVHTYTVMGKELSMTVFNEWKSAAKERDSAYKSCLSAALHYSEKEKD